VARVLAPDMRAFTTFAALLSILLVSFLSCTSRDTAPNKPSEESTAAINLSTVTSSNQVPVFHEVNRANQLPKPVINVLGGIAGPKQPFNKTDFVDPKLPMRQLIVAAVSEKYCIVTYWQGGRALYFRTDIFDLSDGKAKRIWVSQGQGGFTFHDLKEMVESGRMHNDLVAPR
jgi:hypothetical protein